MAGKISYYLNR